MTMTRKEFLKTSVAGALGAAVPGTVASAAQAQERKTPARDRPNVVVIMTDQHRADLMTCAGRDVVPTPGMDRIASRGVRFSHAYCPYPVCVASRMAMLTGLNSHSTGAITNEDRLDWRYRTVAHHFAANGYLTALLGKMHFLDSHNHGFEFYLSINDWLMYLGPKVQHYADEIANHPLGPHFFKTVYDHGAGLPDVVDLYLGKSPWVGNVKRWDFRSMASPLAAEDHLDAFLAREACKFLRRYKDQPFFLVTSFMKPHTPLFAPKEWADKYPVDKMTLPDAGDISGYPPHIQRRIRHHLAIDERLRRAHLAGYLANLAFVDTCVAAVYKELEDLGLLDNTIVVYMSDHGEMCGDHGLFQKFCLFEPSVRIPLIVSWPGRIRAGAVTNALTEYTGLYPTLAELSGTAPPGPTTLIDFPGAARQMDAASFAGVLRNPGAEGPSMAFSEYALRTDVPQYMVRTKRHKYIYNHGSTHELYDHEADPGEMANLIDRPGMKKVRDDLHGQLVARFDPETNRFRRKSR
ncbi:MAG TPA: sulfatase-like hydrolase/transferase [Phycisphaerae bacterium]|nr:sulfatase-like hydrolase/transferase [Phycisphaerae bacterium]